SRARIPRTGARCRSSTASPRQAAPRRRDRSAPSRAGRPPRPARRARTASREPPGARSAPPSAPTARRAGPSSLRPPCEASAVVLVQRQERQEQKREQGDPLGDACLLSPLLLVEEPTRREVGAVDERAAPDHPLEEE